MASFIVMVDINARIASLTAAACLLRSWRAMKRGSACHSGFPRALQTRGQWCWSPAAINTQPSLHGYMPLGAESDMPRLGSVPAPKRGDGDLRQAVAGVR